MLQGLRTWLSAEREDRPEKGTSQDMCPTNGDALLMTAWFSLPALALGAAILWRGV